MMTEEEARTKWCPQIRWTSSDKYDDSFDNRGANCMCIASDCMMWVETDNESYPTDNDFEEPKYYPAGHCGLIK